MIEQIEARTILSKVKDDNYFGLSYNMNLYRGCQHACIYCDSRSICYQLGDLSRIRYKSNAIELLQNELSRKRIKGTIGFGSMNDPYMPVEQETGLSRKALELIAKYRFPVHLLTKSNLVLRDLDLMKEISKVYVAISFTITTADDKLAKLVEPKAPLPSLRFEAMKVLSQNNIYFGITLMPILPYINDTEENIKEFIIKPSIQAPNMLSLLWVSHYAKVQEIIFIRGWIFHFLALKRNISRHLEIDMYVNHPGLIYFMKQ